MKLKEIVQSGIVLLGLVVLGLGTILVGIGRYGFALYAVVGGLIAWCAWLGFSALSTPSAEELPEILNSISPEAQKAATKSELS